MQQGFYAKIVYLHNKVHSPHVGIAETTIDTAQPQLVLLTTLYYPGICIVETGEIVKADCI